MHSKTIILIISNNENSELDKFFMFKFVVVFEGFLYHL